MSFTWSPLEILTPREVFEFSDDIVKALVATEADVWVRWRALCQLDRLPPAQLEPYAKQIVRVLEENPELSYHLLRFGVPLPFKALAQLPTEELSRHVTSILVMLDDEPEANAIGEPDDSMAEYRGWRRPCGARRRYVFWVCFLRQRCFLTRLELRSTSRIDPADLNLATNLDLAGMS